MNFIVWLVFGLIAGAIANFIDPKPSKGGIFGSIVLGVVGAFVGGYLGSVLFGVGITGFDPMSLVVAVAGALLVLFVGRMLMR